MDCRKTIIHTSNSKKRLCFKVKRNSSDSLPAKPTAAQATAMDCGEIIFPVTPPEEFVATARSGLM